MIIEIYREILRLRAAGEGTALATVIKAVGSTPGKALFKMLVYPNKKRIKKIILLFLSSLNLL